MYLDGRFIGPALLSIEPTGPQRQVSWRLSTGTSYKVYHVMYAVTPSRLNIIVTLGSYLIDLVV